MYRFTQDAIDLDELRARLRKMSHAELIAFGKAARRMCSPAANMGKPPRESFVIQLREAREEWMRRKGSANESITGCAGRTAVGDRVFDKVTW